MAFLSTTKGSGGGAGTAFGAGGTAATMGPAGGGGAGAGSGVGCESGAGIDVAWGAGAGSDSITWAAGTLSRGGGGKRPGHASQSAITAPTPSNM